MRISDWISDVCSSDLRGEPSSDLVAIAMAFLGVTVGSDILKVLVTWKSVDLAWRERKRVVYGKSVSVRVDLGGRRIYKKQKNMSLFTTDLNALLPKHPAHHNTCITNITHKENH